MTVVPLRSLTSTDVPAEYTVSIEDALLLRRDFALYGNFYVVLADEDAEASHARVNPANVTPLDFPALDVSAAENLSCGLGDGFQT